VSDSTARLFPFEENVISFDTFSIYTQFLYKQTGINLENDSKNYALFGHRLKKVLRLHQIESFEELAEILKNKNIDPTLKTDFINSLTTNKTEFFREKEHFDLLPKVFSDYIKKQTIYIWCSACSTGQEAYSILFNLHQNLPPAIFNKVKILATDIDTAVLKTATDGVYTEEQVGDLSSKDVETYFESIYNIYSVKPEFKERVYFSQLNLFNYPYPINKKFEIIFCRNVLIYFKQEDRIKICNHLVDYLNPQGHLFLGLSESASIKLNTLDYLGNALYRKKS
jgi:chemotaxis protein methyltransferase CheR